MSKQRVPQWREKTVTTRPTRPKPAPKPVTEAPPVAKPDEDDAPPAPAPPSWAELWREHGLAAIGIFHAALLVRWVVLAQVWASPYQRVANIDSANFEVFARRVWDGGPWLPERAFYQSPFYGWALAAMYKLADPGSWAPRVLQITAGALSTTLVYAIAARVFSRRAGVLAAALFALYGPVILEESLIIKTAWVILGALASFALLLRYAPAEDRRGTVCAGLVFGVTVISAGQWLPALPAMALAAAQLPERSTSRRRRAVGLAFLLAASSPVAAMSAWNTAHAGGFLLTSGDAGLNLYMGNNPEATGLPARPPGLRDVPEYEEGDARRIAERATGRAMTMPEVSRYWASRATDFIRTNTGEWFVVLLQKTQVLWNAYEVPDTSHYAFMRERYVPALRAMLTFGAVGALGLAAMLLLGSTDRRRRALYLMTAPYLAALLLFYIRSRYRFPAVPFLAIFAAGMLDLALRDLADRRWPRLGLTAGVVAVCALFVNRTYCEPAHGNNPAFCLSGDRWYEDEHQQLVNRAVIDGDEAAVRENLRLATRVRDRRLPGLTEHRYARYLRERAEEAQAAGAPEAERDLREAATYARSAAQNEYRVAQSWAEAAAALSAVGDLEGARAALHAASDADPGNPVLALRAARQDALAGDCDAARRRVGATPPQEPALRAQHDAVTARCPVNAR